MQVGIHGVGIYLPEHVRTNDWWPREVVQKWRGTPSDNVVRAQRDQSDMTTPGARAALEGMLEVKDDPFRGVAERRIAPDDMLSSDMEVRAAEDALARSGVPKQEIGLLLVYSQTPDYLTVDCAAIVHKKLGLAPKCFSMSTESACNSFLHQLTVAQTMIQAGIARYALVVQSCTLQRLIRIEDPHSAWFGDVATAAVVGPVADGLGLLAQSHYTDGSLSDALVTSCRGTRWYKPGVDRVYSYVENGSAARAMMLRVPDQGKLVVHEALEQAGYRPDQVDFYASHQATSWFRRVTQEYIGMTRARSFDTFRWTGSLSASSIPMMLGMGEREGVLKPGDLVATYTGGSGVVWSSVVFRWGK